MAQAPAEEPLYKGASLVVVRQALRDKQLEAPFTELLTPVERERFARVVATEWVPVEFARRVYEVAAPLLYPGSTAPVRALGRDIAHEHLGGIYRFVLRFATVAFVVQQSARLWRMYNSKGQLVITDSSDRTIGFAVVDYPEYPAVVRESLAGYIVGAIERTGATNVRVVQAEADPSRWEFRATWR